jgi:hypothetical protein
MNEIASLAVFFAFILGLFIGAGLGRHDEIETQKLRQRYRR